MDTPPDEWSLLQSPKDHGYIVVRLQSLQGKLAMEGPANLKHAR
jgi:hypothetical protein